MREAVHAILSAHNAFWRGALDTTTALAECALAAAERCISQDTSPLVQDVSALMAMPAVALAAGLAAGGRLGEAHDLIRRTVHGIDVEALPDSAGALVALLHGLASDITYAWDDLGAAEHHARTVTDIGIRTGSSIHETHGMALLARVEGARGNTGRAAALLDDAVGITDSLATFDDTHDVVLAESVRALLRDGEFDAAAARLTAHDAAHLADDAKHMQRQIVDLACVRVLLAQRCWDEATVLIDQLAADAERGGWVRNLAEIRALQAVSAWQRHDHAAAFAHLEQALTLTGPAAETRVFLDEAAPMLALLSAYRQSRGPSERVHALIAAFTRTTDASDNDVLHDLTAREIDVLHLLSDGLSNAQIADRLVVAEGTVKRHLHNIYTKLGVGNRTQALVEVRNRGLLSRDALEGPAAADRLHRAAAHRRAVPVRLDLRAPGPPAQPQGAAADRQPHRADHARGDRRAGGHAAGARAPRGPQPARTRGDPRRRRHDAAHRRGGPATDDDRGAGGRRPRCAATLARGRVRRHDR